eukprot:748322-Hanusia_phi.AAC.1
MIPLTINQSCHGFVDEQRSDLDPSCCHTRVKYSFMQICKEGVKVIGSDVVNLEMQFSKLRINSLPSLSGVINRNHEMFKHHRNLLDVIFENDGFANDVYLPTDGDRDLIHARAHEYALTELMNDMSFSCKDAITWQVGKWMITSKVGYSEFAARSFVRSTCGDELDWTTQANAIHAISSYMSSCGLACLRHCIDLCTSCHDPYRLEILYFPCSPSSSHALSASVVQMRDADETGLGGSRLQIVNKQIIEAERGCTRHVMVRNSACSLHELAKRISTIHVENQIMREILRMREDLSEEAQLLTMKHYGRYLKSETLLRTLNEELRRVLTPQELNEAEAFMEKCMSDHELKISCFKGKLQNNYLQGVAQLSTISADMVLSLHCSMPCVTPAFKEREISLLLKNYWKLEMHTIILL